MIINIFGTIIGVCLDILNLPINIDGFTITLWGVLLVGALISTILFFINGIFK